MSFVSGLFSALACQYPQVIKVPDAFLPGSLSGLPAIFIRHSIDGLQLSLSSLRSNRDTKSIKGWLIISNKLNILFIVTYLEDFSWSSINQPEVEQMIDVIIALDFQTKVEVENLLAKFKEPVFTKVGMELFYSEGPQIVRYLK